MTTILLATQLKLVKDTAVSLTRYLTLSYLLQSAACLQDNYDAERQMI